MLLTAEQKFTTQRRSEELPYLGFSVELEWRLAPRGESFPTSGYIFIFQTTGGPSILKRRFDVLAIEILAE